MDEGAARVLRERGSSLLPVGVTGSRAASRPATRSTCVCDGELVGKGIVSYSSTELDRIKGMKSAQVQELMPQASAEAVHRDYFVLA